MTQEEASYILRKFYADGYKSNNYNTIEQALQLAVMCLENFHHWISVEDYSKDKLPPLIDKNNPYNESVQVLFVVVLDGVQYINKGTFDYDTGVWHSLDMQCSFCKENVTHWMLMPEAPSNSEIPNNSKKGGKNET